MENDDKERQTELQKNEQKINKIFEKSYRRLVRADRNVNIITFVLFAFVICAVAFISYNGENLFSTIFCSAAILVIAALWLRFSHNKYVKFLHSHLE